MDTGDPTALDVSVMSGAVSHLVAVLHGANTTLASLEASHNVIV